MSKQLQLLMVLLMGWGAVHFASAATLSDPAVDSYNVIAGAAGAGPPVLDVAVADPAQAPQAGTEPGVLVFNLGEVDVHEYEA
jgi:hypothetical protein